MARAISKRVLVAGVYIECPKPGDVLEKRLIEKSLKLLSDATTSGSPLLKSEFRKKLVSCFRIDKSFCNFFLLYLDSQGLITLKNEHILLTTPPLAGSCPMMPAREVSCYEKKKMPAMRATDGV